MVDLTGFPTDAGGGSVSTEARWRQMARLWASSGVVDGYLNKLIPSHAGGNVTVGTGAAWVDGHYCEQLSSQAVAVASSGLVVIRFTPADNRFQLLWLNGVSNPTQTTATWELPIARMTGGTMSDVREFVSAQSLTTSMIKDDSVTNAKMANDAVNTAELANDAVTAAKMAGPSVNAFLRTGGTMTTANTTLTTGYQTVVSTTFNRPAGWATYEMTVWGAAAIESGSAETCSVRVASGSNLSGERPMEVGGGLHMEVSMRGSWTDLAFAAPAVTVDVRRETAGTATVESAWVQYLAIRTT